VYGEVLLPKIGLRRHVRSRPEPQTLDSTRTRCLALFSPRKGAWHRSRRFFPPRVHRWRLV